MDATCKHLCLIGVAVGLIVPGLAVADGAPDVARGPRVKAPVTAGPMGSAPTPTPTPRISSPTARVPARVSWPAAIKHRNARYAVLGRSFDASGDEHEAFVLQFELGRYSDRLGDLEEIRVHTAFLKGRRGTLHALLKRDEDHQGDVRQADLARLTLSRRFADFRRLRDFSGDKGELSTWRRDRLRWGDLGPMRIGTQQERLVHASQADDPEKRRRSRNKLDQRETGKLEGKVKRNERDEERRIERSLQDGGRRSRRMIERAEDRAEDRAGDRAEDRADDRADDDAESELDEDGDERDEERALEREEEAATEKAITSEENGEAP